MRFWQPEKTTQPTFSSVLLKSLFSWKNTLFRAVYLCGICNSALKFYPVKGLLFHLLQQTVLCIHLFSVSLSPGGTAAQLPECTGFSLQALPRIASCCGDTTVTSLVFICRKSNEISWWIITHDYLLLFHVLAILVIAPGVLKCESKGKKKSKC